MSGLLLVHGAELFAPEPRGARDVLLGGGRVLAIAPRLDLGGLDVERVDARGLIACPGLVDSLVHLSGGGGEGGFATRTVPLAASDALRAGVTTLIGALGTDDVTRTHADLLACARALAPHGLTALALTGSYRMPARTLTGSVRDDLVLVPDLIGVGEIAIADHRGSHPSVDELARLAADSRVGGMLAGKPGTVLVHVGDDDAALELLDTVVRRHPVPRTQWHPTHGNRHARLLDEAMRWVDAGGTIDLTTSTTDALVEAGDVPAADALARLLAAGLPVARISMSSDAQASLPHFDGDGRLLDLQVAPIASLLGSVRDAVQRHRIPLGVALQSVTSTPARIWGLARKGRIAVDADADVLLLDPDTLAVRTTIAGGRIRIHDRD